MKNVEIQTKDKKLIITVDTAKSFGPSKTGKTEIVASTEGNQKIDIAGVQLHVGLNIYRKKQE